MPRTIVYSSPTTSAQDADGYTERLSKYIPAEVLAAFLPLVGLTGNRGMLLYIAFWTGVLATVVYLYIRARQETDPKKRPRWFFYVFAVVAFFAWAMATSDPIRNLFGWMDELSARFALALAAFAIPALDLAIDALFARR